MQRITGLDEIVFSYIFNLYDFLVLTITMLAVLLILPLLLKDEVKKSDWMLSGFLFTQGATALSTVLIYNETLGPITHELFYPYHAIPKIALIGLQGFLVLGYCLALTGAPIRQTIKRSGLILSLGIINISIAIGLLFHLGPQGKMYFPGVGLVQLQSIILGIIAINILWRYDNKIRHNFSNIRQVKLTWLNYSVAGFTGVWMLSFTACVLGMIGLYDLAVSIGTFANLPPLLLMSAMVVYSQSVSMTRDMIDPEEREVSDAKVNEVAPSPALQQQIEDLMIRVKIYQDPDLRLDGLADSMNLSPRRVSSLLNGFYQKSFYDFINEFRVKDAQNQLSDPENQHKSIQRIFEDAGFNSKTTFNTLFKKLTGKTPSEYRKTSRVFEQQIDAQMH